MPTRGARVGIFISQTKSCKIEYESHRFIGWQVHTSKSGTVERRGALQQVGHIS